LEVVLFGVDYKMVLVINTYNVSDIPAGTISILPDLRRVLH